MPSRHFLRAMIVACTLAFAPAGVVAQAPAAAVPSPAEASINARLQQRMAEGRENVSGTFEERAGLLFYA